MTESTTLPRFGDWIETYSGRKFHLLDCRPGDFDIVDIAHALSFICRYNGHTKRFYSVAEHSLYISYACPPDLALWALLHDSPEAYIGDVTRPLKPYLKDYKAIERRIMAAICEQFGLAPDQPPEIKELDSRILHNERRDMMADTSNPWNLPGEPIPGLVIEGFDTFSAYGLFMARFKELTDQGQSYYYLSDRERLAASLAAARAEFAARGGRFLDLEEIADEVEARRNGA